MWVHSYKGTNGLSPTFQSWWCEHSSVSFEVQSINNLHKAPFLVHMEKIEISCDFKVPTPLTSQGKSTLDDSDTDNDNNSAQENSPASEMAHMMENHMMQ